MRDLALRADFQALPWAGACGLRPRVWICVRSGFSREELKEAILGLGHALNAQAFISLDQLALQIQGRKNSETLTSRESRQEFLNELLRYESLSLSPTGELRRLRRLPGFLRKLDRSLQTARTVALGQDERKILDELLTEKCGHSVLRKEILGLIESYEQSLKTAPDLPAILSSAIETLNQGGAVLPHPLPEELWVFSGARPEALEAEFWDRFQQQLPIRVRFFPERTPSILNRPAWERETTQPSVRWERWHTLDDSALRLVEVLREEVGVDQLPHCALVIPDDPGVRRSILRALAEGGIPLEDQRDPTRIRRDEGVKSALLMLQVIASDYERETVSAWLQASFPLHPDLSTTLKAIQESGARSGLNSYSKSGRTAFLRKLLDELESELGGRRTFTEVSERHLRYLETWVGVDSDRLWILQFFEKFWRKFGEDLQRAWSAMEVSSPRLRLRAWMERVEARLREAKPPEEREKLLGGLSLYRVSQVAIRDFDRVIFFGLPASALQPSDSSDFFLSARERDVLGTEFDVQSTARTREDLRLALQAWFQMGKDQLFLDAERDQEGRERSTLDSLFLEWFGLGWENRFRCENRGGMPRWAAGYGLSDWRSTSQVKSPHRHFAEGSKKPALDASDLEAMSRCGFQALFGRRWRLEDLRAPAPDLWADVSGTLLHEAVKALVRSRVPDTLEFTMTPGEALRDAWSRRPPHGLLRGRRVEELEKRRLTRILEQFLEEERCYLARSGATTVVTDDVKLALELPEFRIQGVPDRIDEHPDGLLVADYKSSSSVPQGDEMIDQGYRLQLPFYGLAAAATRKRPVIAAQFIILNASGTRKKGIFFRPWNGDKPGALTTFSRKTKSLFDETPETVWSRAQDQIENKARAFIAGDFEARPFNAKECDRCRFRAVCGALRRTAAASDPGENSGGEL